MYNNPGGGSQNPNKTRTKTCMHHYAESGINRVPNFISTTSLRLEYTHGSPQSSSNLHACISRPQFLILSLYYYIFVPISRRITGHPHGGSQLQRVGIGLAISILSVGWAAIFERIRRNYAISHGYETSFLSPMPDLSAFWLLIQYCLIGIAEVFCIMGLLEFLYEEAPDAMRSIGSAYAAVAGGLGCFAATLLNNIINSITENTEKRRTSWLSQNINTGHFDYPYWVLTGLSIINFCGFLYAAKIYKYRSVPAG